MKLFSKQLLVIVYTRKFTFKKLITVSIKHRILWFYLSVIKPKAKDRSLHCVKKAHIWNFSGSYLAAYGLNTDQKNYEQGHFLRSVVFVNLPKSYLKNVLQIENITTEKKFQYTQNKILHFKDGVFCSLSALRKANFAKFLTGLFEKQIHPCICYFITADIEISCKYELFYHS